jgi:WD40 repeat protein
VKCLKHTADDALALARQVDRACNAFEAAWRAGDRPRAEDFLGGVTGPARAALLRELIPLEVDYRRDRGEATTPEEYQARFPEVDPSWLAEALVQGATETLLPGCPATPPDAAAAAQPAVTAGSVADGAPVIRRLGGYELLSEIARGGMGIVYRARQVTLHRTVALKAILAGQLASPAEVQRFRIEAEAAASLDHPNIVPIYEVGEQDGEHFYSMRLIEGGSLAQRIAAGDQAAATPCWGGGSGARITQDERWAAGLVATVARAVHYAHQRGILHRDLKPANILLDAAGQPHVSDFGLAKQVQGDGHLTRSGVIVGTPGYMAPEQAAGHANRLTTAADVYALGAILYELLTGRPPFKAATPLDTLLAVLHEEVQAPSRLRPMLARDLETVCLKCLDKDPQRRYASALALAEDLERFLAGEPVAARAVSARERAVKWVRRHPAPAALALVTALAALALVGVGVAWSYSSRLSATNAELELAKSATERANAQLESSNARLVLAVRETGAKRTEADSQRAEAHRQRGLAERYLYAAHMLVAETRRKQGRIEETLRLLELHTPTPEHPVDLRGLEWYYQLRLCRASQLPLRGHTGALLAFWVSPDGRRVASAGADRTVRSWDLAAGRLVTSVPLRADKLSTCAFSPDARRLAGVGPDNAVRIYDAATGRELACCKGHARQVHCLAFSPDGKHVASGSGEDRTGGSKDYSVRVWDARTGAEVISLTNLVGPVYAIAFSPDGRYLASGVWAPQGQHNVQVWDWRACREKLFMAGPHPATRALAFSPDGRYLTAAGGGTTPAPTNPTVRLAALGELKVWELATCQEVFGAWEPAESFGGVAFSPDGKRVAACGWDGLIKLWDSVTGQEALTCGCQTGEATALAFSPAGPRLFSGGADQALRVWEVGPDPEPLALDPKIGPLYDVAYSPDGRRLAASARSVRVWETATGQELCKFPDVWPEQKRFAFSPDGRRLAWGGKVWDVATGRELAGFRGALGRDYGAGYGVAFSPDGQCVATTGSRGAAVWDARTGKVVFTLKEPTTFFYAVAFSPDGKWLASAGEDRIVRIWDAVTGRAMHSFRDSAYAVYALAFSPDSTRLAAATGSWQDGMAPGEVKVWDVAARRELYTLRGHTESVWGVAFSPDGTRLASCSGIHVGREKPGEIKLWDAISGLELLTLRNGHKGRIYSVAFSPDGKHLASAGADGVVKIWGPAPSH